MTIALILAAGSGERLGADRPKALVELGGHPLLWWSVNALRAVPGIETIVLALPPGTPGPRDTQGPPELLDAPELSGLLDTSESPGVVVVAGGAVRSESVRLALAAAGGGGRDGQELVLVHDAARPLVTVALARDTIRALETDRSIDGAIAAAPTTDTIKRVGEDGVVRETLDRRELWAVQTPQVFRRAALERATDVPAEVLARATDDAWLLERAGGRVGVVESSRENLKVTTPHDLVVAEMLLASRRG